MRNVSEQSSQWEGVVPVCCGAPFAARLLLRYLIMKNKQPWGTLNFHKTIRAFLNPSAPSSSNQRRRETDRRTAKKKKKRVTDKQSTNKQKVRRSDGVAVLRLLPRWHHPATTKNLMLLYFKCTIIHNYTRVSRVSLQSNHIRKILHSLYGIKKFLLLLLLLGYSSTSCERVEGARGPQWASCSPLAIAP